MHRLQSGTRFSGAHPAWVRPEGVHVTLVFLGWQPPERLAAAQRALSAASACAPFGLEIGGVGLFPDPRSPRVVSVELHGNLKGLFAVQKALADACRAGGFEIEDRAFRPHLTLARIKSQKGLAGLRDVVKSHANLAAGSFHVDHVTLYRSILEPSGARYIAMGECMLGAAHPPAGFRESGGQV